MHCMRLFNSGVSDVTLFNYVMRQAFPGWGLYHCQNCGHLLATDAVFCPSCGSGDPFRLNRAAPIPQPEPESQLAQSLRNLDYAMSHPRVPEPIHNTAPGWKDRYGQPIPDQKFLDLLRQWEESEAARLSLVEWFNLNGYHQ
jgi:hypothetical protein